MYQTRNVTEEIVWVGASDRRLALFENIFPIPRGVSYNSYVLLDEKTVLLDTVDASVAGQFFENLEHVLADRTLDYLVVNHMEPDHCAMIRKTTRRQRAESELPAGRSRSSGHFQRNVCVHIIQCAEKRWSYS